MKLCTFPDYESLCDAVASEVTKQLARKPESVLVFPTGNTPLGLFKVLAGMHTRSAADFSSAHIVVLDEYADIAPDDPRSLTGWLHRELLAKIEIPASRIHDFRHGPDSIERAVSKLGGLDMVILGLGPNGHLAFNEPGSAFGSRSRRISLTLESIRSNAAYWGSENLVPSHGLTLGLGTLASARSIILMVSGETKKQILADTIHGPVSTNNPATMIRNLTHARVFADKASMGVDAA
ncbi:MAG: 6-phosphogluconolactonase [Aestuariivirga sp.]